MLGEQTAGREHARDAVVTDFRSSPNFRIVTRFRIKSYAANGFHSRGSRGVIEVYIVIANRYTAIGFVNLNVDASSTRQRNSGYPQKVYLVVIDFEILQGSKPCCGV
jgi:hypothetical protein